MKRVLVGYDGSLFAAEAARLAGRLAVRLEAMVLVYCAAATGSSTSEAVPSSVARGRPIQVPRVTRGAPAAGRTRRSAEPGAMHLAAAAAMAREGAAIVRSCGVAAGAVSASAVPGAAADVLVDAAGREGVDLIVVGHRGRGALTDVLLGGVATRVATLAPCPVLVVRGPAPTSIAHILVATNGSAPSQHVTEAAVVLARSWEAGITLLHVIDATAFPASSRTPTNTTTTTASTPEPVEAEAEERERGKRALAWGADLCQRAGVPAERTQEMGPVAETIMAVADAIDATIVAIGRPDARVAAGLGLGRDSDAVLSGAPRPVLIAGERVESLPESELVASAPPPQPDREPRGRYLGPFQVPSWLSWLWFWDRKR